MLDVDVIADPAAATVALDPVRSRLLAELGTPASAAALAARLGIDRTVMTYLLDDLERAELVVRKASPTDRRTRLVVATETGRARLAELDRRLAHAETHVLSGLSKAEQESLKSLLGRLAAQVNELDPVPDACAVVEEIAATRP